jgi:hypothetical protein
MKRIIKTKAMARTCNNSKTMARRIKKGSQEKNGGREFITTRRSEQ